GVEPLENLVELGPLRAQRPRLAEKLILVEARGQRRQALVDALQLGEAPAGEVTCIGHGREDLGGVALGGRASPVEVDELLVQLGGPARDRVLEGGGALGGGGELLLQRRGAAGRGLGALASGGQLLLERLDALLQLGLAGARLAQLALTGGEAIARRAQRALE